MLSTQNSKHHSRKNGVVLRALGLVVAVGLLVPAGALAAGSGGGGSGGADLTGIFTSLGEQGKAIGAVVGGLMLIVMLIVAWAKQSVAAAALAVGMGIVAAMAVNGGLWNTSERTAKSLSSGSGSGLVQNSGK